MKCLSSDFTTYSVTEAKASFLFASLHLDISPVPGSVGRARGCSDECTQCDLIFKFSLSHLVHFSKYP